MNKDKKKVWALLKQKKDKINKDYIKSVQTLGKILNNEIGQLVLLNQDGILDEIHAIQDDLDFKTEINGKSENEDDDNYEHEMATEIRETIPVEEEVEIIGNIVFNKK